MRHSNLDQVDQETRIILNVIRDSFSVENIDFDNVNWTRILRRASLNRVLYIFTKKLLNNHKISKFSKLEKMLMIILNEGEKYIESLNKTVREIKTSLLHANIPFLIFKTYRTLPYVTLDVDILVRYKDFGKAAEALLKESIDSANSWDKLYQPKMEAHVKEAGLLKIDLYTFQTSFWQGWDEYLDIEFIWKNPRKINFLGEEWITPSIEAELALVIVHILHERLQITLLDFLFIKDIHRNIKWNVILEQAKKYGWYNAFLRFISIINELNAKLCPEETEFLIAPDIFEEKVTFPTSKIGVPLSMPYVYQLPYAIELFIERFKTSSCLRVVEFSPYYFFAIIRYYLTKREKVPIYHHWFQFKNIQFKRGK